MSASGIESLAPVPASARIFGLASYVLMFWASLIVIQGFVLGQALIPPQGVLTLAQGLLVIVLAALIMALFMALNGQAGLRYGIPYCIQARAAFGTRGARLATALRLVPALIWYGFGTWIAALSMHGIIETLTGFGPAGATFAYFVVLQALQTWLAYRGVESMKRFNVVASVALVLLMGHLFWRIVTAPEFTLTGTLTTAGDWGLPFWAGVNAAVGILVAVIASASDLTRYLEPRQRTLWWGHLLGILPPLLFMTSFGFVAAMTTGVWDPIAALMQLSPEPALMCLLLAFVLVAQFSTNLTVNIMPPAFIFEEMFGIDWRRGVVLAGVIGTLTCPWLLLDSGATFITFINYYTAFFGPLVGCMLAEAWRTRGALHLDELYLHNGTGRYWYRAGINWAGMLTTLAVGAATMVACLEVAWLVGMPLGVLMYRLSYALLNARAVGAQGLPAPPAAG